jgi:4-hydroxy-tetrahydrodipicolinate synthase
MSFEGTFPALVTPFVDGRLDEPALRALIRHVLAGGVDGVVACGTTGEAPTLSRDEWARVVTVCVEGCGTRPVIAGTGTNDTRAVIEKTKLARELGAAGALVVSPYYNKPSPAGLVAHFEAVAGETGMPVILYNVPGRTGSNMSPDTVARLSQVPNIVGIKDAAGSVDQFSELLRRCEPGFKVLSGDDSLSLPLYALGGHGVISTVANVAPGPMARIYKAFCEGNIEEARQLHFRLLPLFRALFIETNPCPAKFACSLLGYGRNELRLPLVSITPASEAAVREAMAAAGILPEA